MTKPDLDSKLKELDHQVSYPSVTLLLPLNEDFDLESPDQILKNLIKEVKLQLEKLPDCPAFHTVSKKLNTLPVRLPPQNVYKSLAAFISEDFMEIIPLDFDVEKKVSVGTGFDIKDIFRLNNSIGSGIETKVEKLKRIIIERYLEFKPYNKRTF